MPAEVKASREAVFEAAAELVRKGGQPSCSKVRAITSGSYSSVCKHLKEWRSTESGLPAAPVAVPERLTVAVQQCAALLWKEISAETTARMLQEQEAARLRIADMDLQLTDSLDEIRRLEAQLCVAEESIRALEQEVKDVNERRVRAEALAERSARELAMAKLAERKAIESAAMLRGQKVVRKRRTVKTA